MSLTQFLSLTAAHRLALQTIHAFLYNWNARGVNRTERARPGRSESSTHCRHLMCYCHISGMRHPCTQPLACHFRLIQATKKTDYWHRHHYLTPHSSPISSILQLSLQWKLTMRSIPHQLHENWTPADATVCWHLPQSPMQSPKNNQC